MEIEENTLTRNIKGIDKFLEIYEIRIVGYYIRSESGIMIAGEQI